LVLLAVVLIVALVSVALLGFFPGMASDARETQSKTYWASASPIAITEWAAKAHSNPTYSMPYIRVRNVGPYPVRITKLLGSDGAGIGMFRIASGTDVNISDYYYMAPGEEKYFGDNTTFSRGLPENRMVDFCMPSVGGDWYILNTASSICNAAGSATSGTLAMDEFGFEYVEYINGQQVTKRQVGKPLVIKCIS